MINKALKLAGKSGYTFDATATLADHILKKEFWLALGKTQKWDDVPTEVFVCVNQECEVSKNPAAHFGTREEFLKRKRAEFPEVEEEKINEMEPTCATCHAPLIIQPRHITQNWLIQALRTCEIYIKQGKTNAEKYVKLIVLTGIK